MNNVSIYDLLTSDYTPETLLAAFSPLLGILVFVFTAILLWTRVRREDGSMARKGKIAMTGWAVCAAMSALSIGQTDPGRAMLMVPLMILILFFIYTLSGLRPRTKVSGGIASIMKIALTAQPVIALALMVNGGYQSNAGFMDAREMGDEMAAVYAERITGEADQEIVADKVVWVAEDDRQRNRAIWSALTLDAGHRLWNARNPDQIVTPDRSEGAHRLAIVRPKVDGISVMPVACHYRDGDLGRIHFLWAMTNDLTKNETFSKVVALCPASLDPDAETTAPEAALTAIME